MKICAASVATDDYYPVIDKHIPGGNSLNFAAQCALLGHLASFIGAVGDDDMGRWLVKNVPGLGIDCSRMYQTDGRTASNVLRITEEGERYNLPEDWHNGVYGEFRLSRSDWEFAFSHDAVMITLYDPSIKQFREYSRKNDSVHTTVDCLDNPDIGLLKEILPEVSAVQFSAAPEYEEQLIPLSEKSDTLIIHTRDALGSALFLRGKKYSQPAVKVDKVLDTTGCGDTFHASFTCKYLDGDKVEDCLAFAAGEASKRLAHYGGIELNL